MSIELEQANALPAEDTKVSAAVKKMDETMRDKILEQCTKEYDHALKYRQYREPSWKKIDDLYFGRKVVSLVSRANVHIPKLQGSVETLLGKINRPPYINFDSEDEADRVQVAIAMALLKKDMRSGLWTLKDVLMKKEAVLYGRAIEKKYSMDDSVNGFVDVLEVVDDLDFLIDPMAGGIEPFKLARYCGQDNIIRTKFELENEDAYDQDVVADVVSHLGSDASADNRYRSIANRRLALGLSNAVLVSDDAVKLVEWYTTYEGVRYYVLFSPEHKKSIRIEKLKELFGNNEFPFASWAPFPSAFEFWTPAPAELFKEINIVENVLISQILDNNAFRNYGQVYYDKNKVLNPKMLDPTPQGKVPVNGDPRNIIMNRDFPSIIESMNIFQLLETTWDRETGVTTQAKGVPHSKRMSATEFSGLIDEIAERIFTSNILYQEHYHRLVGLYVNGLKENMTEKRKVRILGINGMETMEIDKTKMTADLDIVIKVGVDEESEEQVNRDKFFDALPDMRKRADLNQSFLDEKQARYLGFSDDEVDRLLHPELEGDWMILSAAASENEKLLKEKVEPNTAATTGHIQKHLDFIQRAGQRLKTNQIKRILDHANNESIFAAKNMESKARTMIERARMAMQQKENMMPGSAPQPPAPSPAMMPMQGQPPGGMMPPPQPMMPPPAPPSPLPPMQGPMLNAGM